MQSTTQSPWLMEYVALLVDCGLLWLKCRHAMIMPAEQERQGHNDGSTKSGPHQLVQGVNVTPKQQLLFKPHAGGADDPTGNATVPLVV